jgi:sarcosine oxidase
VEGQVDVVVVGAGVMGLATARALAREGRSVAVLEQFELGHSRGSSHGTSRIFRLSYADPAFARKALDTLPLWRDLEAEVGETLLVTTGSLDVGGDLTDYQATLTENGVATEMLDGRRLASRFPGLRLPDDEALFHAAGGFLRADRVVGALRRSAANHGAAIQSETKVLDLELAEDGVVLESTDGRLEARAVVVAAGAWAKDILSGLGIDLPVRVSRQTVAHFRLPAGNGLPTVIDRGNPPSPELEAYALPSPGIGLKAGVHRWGQETDPDAIGAPDPAAAEAAAEWVRDRYDVASRKPVQVETCLYTTTEDESFVIERHGRVVVCSACSGHGFKFTPEIGRQAAALALDALAH